MDVDAPIPTATSPRTFPERVAHGTLVALLLTAWGLAVGFVVREVATTELGWREWTQFGIIALQLPLFLHSLVAKRETRLRLSPFARQPTHAALRIGKWILGFYALVGLVAIDAAMLFELTAHELEIPEWCFGALAYPIPILVLCIPLLLRLEEREQRERDADAHPSG